MLLEKTLERLRGLKKLIHKYIFIINYLKHWSAACCTEKPRHSSTPSSRYCANTMSCMRSAEAEPMCVAWRDGVEERSGEMRDGGEERRDEGWRREGEERSGEMRDGGEERRVEMRDGGEERSGEMRDGVEERSGAER
jgi:hypothetical protein